MIVLRSKNFIRCLKEREENDEKELRLAKNGSKTKLVQPLVIELDGIGICDETRNEIDSRWAM